MRIQRGHGEGEVEDVPLGFVLNLGTGHAGAPGAIHQVTDLGGIIAREQVAQARRPRHLLLWKNSHQRTIDALNAAIGGERDNAGRDALENRFGEAPPRFQLLTVRLQRLGHLIESFY